MSDWNEDKNTFHHEFMGQYVDAMAFSLYSWDKNHGTGGDLGWDYYRSMAFAGLSYLKVDANNNPILDENGQKIYLDTDSFIELVPSIEERNRIKKISINEATGNQDAESEKCN